VKIQNYRFLDYITVVLIGLMACLHWSAWSSYPPDVDPINFIVALHTYNISADAPHPPGYPLFVFLGRLSAMIVGTQYAYQLVNLALLIGAVFCLYCLFRKLGYPKIGLSVAVLLMSHPLCWAATVIPESYISDALLSSAIVSWIVLMKDRLKPLMIGIPLILFTFGLFRPVSCLLLFPLAVGSVMISAIDHKKRLGIITAITGLFSIISAYGVTVVLAGGIEAYRAATDRVMGSSLRSVSFFAGASFAAHVAMILKLIIWGLCLAAPALFLVSLFIILRNKSPLIQPHHKSALKIGLLWIIPPAIFYALVYYLKPTYQLIYLPCFMILIAWTVQEGFQRLRQKIKWLIIASIVLAQLCFFFFAPSTLPAPAYQLSYGYLRQKDVAWTQLLQDLAPFRQENTLLVWVNYPNLTPYALRLLDWVEPVALFNQGNGSLQYLLPSTMTWLPSNVESFTISEKYRRVAIIYTSNGIGAIQSVNLTRPEMRQVKNLLHLVQPETFLHKSNINQTGKLSAPEIS
jgi:hypothetical protein